MELLAQNILLHDISYIVHKSEAVYKELRKIREISNRVAKLEAMYKELCELREILGSSMMLHLSSGSLFYNRFYGG